MKGSDAIGLGEYLLLSPLCIFRPLHPHYQNVKRNDRLLLDLPMTLFLGLVPLFLFFDMHNHLASRVRLI